MKLCDNSIKTDNSWKEKGYALPTFDREKMINETVAILSGYTLVQVTFLEHSRQICLRECLQKVLMIRDLQ
jgi:hypothetical protein